ncbi:phosphomannomutase/phosphoglucomutase [Brachybacterium sp. DNPG3]
MSEPQEQQPVIDLRGIVSKIDVRGVAGVELTEEVARAFGAAFADVLEDSALIVAHDMRVSSPELAAAFADGAARRGATVAEAGLASTDQLYCASGLHRAAGAMITASHNPPEDNGFKLCLPGAKPISRDDGLDDIRQGAERYLAGGIPEVAGGRRTPLETLSDYADTVLRLAPLSGRRPLRVVVDAANAMAGLTVPAVLGRTAEISLVPLHFELDGTFPNHPANPLIPENLEDLRDAVIAEGADIGLAFDGDADRCVVLDEQGRPVPPSAITALIATREIARVRAAGEERPVVVANAVSSRHVFEAVEAAGGEALRSPVGHSLIKALMAQHEAVFGGEHSAHYYFRDFFRADSGMLAALHVLAALEETDEPLSALVAEHDPYPASGEINTRPASAEAARAAIERVRAHVLASGAVVDDLDGLTAVHWTGPAADADRAGDAVGADEDAASSENWWLSLRSSNSEPLLRLNVEAETAGTVERVRDEILAIVRAEEAPGDEASAGEASGEEAPAAESVAAATGGAMSEPAEDGLRPAGASGADVPSWVRARLRCPDCGGELRDVDAALQCMSCHRLHAVEGGIPVLIAGRADQVAGQAE